MSAVYLIRLDLKFSEQNAYMIEKKVLTMVSVIFKGGEEHSMFPRILKSGYINQVTKETPYLLLATDFSGNQNCNIADKIAKLEQCFDEVTIALIGIQIVSVLLR